MNSTQSHQNCTVSYFDVYLETNTCLEETLGANVTDLVMSYVSRRPMNPHAAIWICAPKFVAPKIVAQPLERRKRKRTSLSKNMLYTKDTIQQALAQNNINVSVAQYDAVWRTADALQEVADKTCVLIPFGKYRGNKTLSEVYREDPHYFEWVKNWLEKEGAFPEVYEVMKEM